MTTQFFDTDTLSRVGQGATGLEFSRLCWLLSGPWQSVNKIVYISKMLSCKSIEGLAVALAGARYVDGLVFLVFLVFLVCFYISGGNA